MISRRTDPLVRSSTRPWATDRMRTRPDLGVRPTGFGDDA